MGRPRCSSARDRCVPMLCVPYPVPPAGHSLHLCRGDLRFRADDWVMTGSFEVPRSPWSRQWW